MSWNSDSTCLWRCRRNQSLRSTWLRRIRLHLDTLPPPWVSSSPTVKASCDELIAENKAARVSRYRASNSQHLQRKCPWRITPRHQSGSHVPSMKITSRNLGFLRRRCLKMPRRKSMSWASSFQSGKTSSWRSGSQSRNHWRTSQRKGPPRPQITTRTHTQHAHHGSKSSEFPGSDGMPAYRRSRSRGFPWCCPWCITWQFCTHTWGIF